MKIFDCGQSTKTQPPLAPSVKEQSSNWVFSTLSVAEDCSDCSRTSIESALGQRLNNVFVSASSPPLISKEAVEVRETCTVPVLPMHEVNDDLVVELVVELSLMVTF